MIQSGIVCIKIQDMIDDLNDIISDLEDLDMNEYEEEARDHIFFIETRLDELKCTAEYEKEEILMRVGCNFIV